MNPLLIRLENRSWDAHIRSSNCQSEIAGLTEGGGQRRPRNALRGNTVTHKLISFPVTQSHRQALAESPVRFADPETIRLVIAGSEPMSREGLQALLIGNREFEVVGEAEDGDAGLLLASRKRAHILLVDVPPIRDCSLEFIRGAAAESLRIRVLLLLSPSRKTEALTALRLGARGVLSKDSANRHDLNDALRSVASGGYWLGHGHAPSLAEALESLTGSPDSDPDCDKFGLTPRELQVVPLMVRGYSNPEIARELSISVQTVKHHCSHIYDKVGASNRMELALFATHHGLVSRSLPSHGKRPADAVRSIPGGASRPRIPSRLS